MRQGEREGKTEANLRNTDIHKSGKSFKYILHTENYLEGEESYTRAQHRREGKKRDREGGEKRRRRKEREEGGGRREERLAAHLVSILLVQFLFFLEPLE